VSDREDPLRVSASRHVRSGGAKTLSLLTLRLSRSRLSREVRPQARPYGAPHGGETSGTGKRRDMIRVNPRFVCKILP